MRSWQLHEAKNRLSEVISEARGDAQVITVRGQDAAVVLSIDEYRRLTKPQMSLVDFLRDSPLTEVELDLARDSDVGREIAL